MAIERVARLVEPDVVWEHHRQLLARQRHRTARLAVDDRDWRAPVALAGHPPVAQAILDRAVAPTRGFGAADHLGRSLVRAQPVEEARVNRHARRVLGRVADRLGGELSTCRNDAPDWQMILLRKFEVALI